MAKSIKLTFVPASLKRVREISGCTPEQAAKSVGKDVEIIKRWENDQSDELPTLAQARKLEKLYRYPLTLFLSDEVPDYIQAPDIHDFRTLPAGVETPSSTWSRNLRWLLRQMEYRQEFVIEIASQWELPYQEWVGSEAQTGIDSEDLAVKMRELLGVSQEEQKKWRDTKAALKAWIERFENRAGVFVMQTDNVSSPIEISEMRGVSMADNQAPFIMLNSKDAEAGRIFTLFHEFAHLWIKQSGISAWSEPDFLVDFESDSQVERFCNQSAASALMPKQWFIQEWDALHELALDKKVAELARAFSVSREAIAIKATRLDQISYGDYSGWRKDHLEAIGRYGEETARRNGTSSSGNYYLTLRRNAGRKYIDLVLGSFFERYIGIKEASHLLDIKVGNIYKLAEFCGFNV